MKELDALNALIDKVLTYRPKEKLKKNSVVRIRVKRKVKKKRPTTGG